MSLGTSKELNLEWQFLERTTQIHFHNMFFLQRKQIPLGLILRFPSKSILRGLERERGSITAHIQHLTHRKFCPFRWNKLYKHFFIGKQSIDQLIQGWIRSQGSKALWMTLMWISPNHLLLLTRRMRTDRMNSGWSNWHWLGLAQHDNRQGPKLHHSTNDLIYLVHHLEISSN